MTFSVLFLRRLSIALLTLVLGLSTAHAGISYSLLENQAAPGETVTVRAILFNDGSSTLSWTPPQSLVMQWRGKDSVTRSLAQLQNPRQPVNVPVNNFVIFNWTAVVPTALTGIQAVSVEGAPDLFALDTSRGDPNPLLASLAETPIVDAGAAAAGEKQDPVLNEQRLRAVGAAGATSEYGPSAIQAAHTPAGTSAFENFRNAISLYEPIYFVLGNRPETNARFQLSFKYRLFNPTDPTQDNFMDHFYAGYTQTSLWDLSSDSLPFVDTTYNPSVFWYKERMWDSADNRFFVGLNTGVEHASNGKDGDDSRSLNDFYIQPEFAYRFDGGSTLKFSPRVKAYFAMSENGDYPDYLGRVDWKVSWAQDNGLKLAGTYRQGHHGRNSMQLDASWPLQRLYSGMNGYLYLQYYRGYGETLLGYRHKSEPQLRIGLALVP
ncbi:MAG: phospholipase A [Paenalcaligenes sp.]